MIGFSIYSQNYNIDYINSMISSGINDAFVSLHVNEEINNKFEIVKFLNILKEKNLNIIADISPVTFELFSIGELQEIGINKVRLDFGFTLDQTVKLSSDFNIVLNASTICEEDILYLKEKGMDMNSVEFLHNFYPKEETGLCSEQLMKMNEIFLKHKLKISAFIPGDGILRGPIYKGLPTLEEHRDNNFLYNYLHMKKYCDNIYIGDISLKPESLKQLKLLMNNVVAIPINNINLDESFLNVELTIRKDSNHLNIRIEESRTILKSINSIEPKNCMNRKKGVITQDNVLSKRYNGEVMIVKKDLPCKENLNVVGFVEQEYVNILDLLSPNYKIMLYD